MDQTLDLSFFTIIATSFVLIWIASLPIIPNRSREALSRILRTANKPLVSTMDSGPHKIRLYPRQFLERLYSSIIPWIKNLSKKLYRAVSISVGRKEKKTPGFRFLSFDLISTIFFFPLLIADIIFISSTLALMGFDIPSNLYSKFDIALIGSSVLPLAAGLLYFQVFSPDNTDFKEYTNQLFYERSRKSIRSLSLLVILLSFITLIALSLYRFSFSFLFDSSESIELITNTVIFGITPLNISLAVFMLFKPAIRGGIVALGLLFDIYGFCLSLLFIVVDLQLRAMVILAELFYLILMTPVSLIAKLWERI